MIHVLAIITAKPGMRATILEAFHANMPAVHAEDGCIVVETWATADALKAHGAAPHRAAYGAKTRPMVASRVIHVLQNG